MEELRSTRHWGKKAHDGSAVLGSSAYEEFLGGLPRRHMTPFPARFEDYCEIFGSAASASSIPLLELPMPEHHFVADDDSDQRLGIDYSEIFGGLSTDSAFFLSYEELFGCSRGSQASSFFDGRARYAVLSEQQANEASEHSLEGYSEDRLANLEMDEISSVPHHSDDVNSKQFTISNHKTSWGIIDDSISEKTNAVKVVTSPEYTVVVDARDHVLEMKDQQVNKEITNHTGTKRYIGEGGQYNEAQSNSSFSATNSENLKADHEPSKSNCDSLLDSPENEKHLSRSSSYHSASSGDISLSDVEYLNISEIRLKTKPFHGPPPSRPPPQLIKKPEHPTMVNMDSRSDLEERSLLKPKLKCHILRMEDNSCCYDNEMDPSSAAIASVAAVKAAMEQAQARLKIAKEMMDKKRDKYKRKVDQPKAINSEEDGADYEVALKSCSKVVTSNNFLKGNNSTHEYTCLGKEETSNAGIRSLNHEKKGQFPSTSGEIQQQVSPDNGFGSTEATCEFDELSGEWKTEKKYHELIRNGSLLNEVKGNYMHDNEKKEKTAIYGSQDIYKDNKNGDQAFEVLENQKSSEPSGSVEKLENDHNLNGASMAYVDSYKNVANEIMEDSVLTEGKRKHEAYGCHVLDETQKKGDVLQDNTTGDDHNSPNSAMDSCLCQDSENMFQALSSSFESGADNNFCEEIVSNAAEKTFRNVGNRRDFQVTHVNFELNESNNVFKVANEAKFQGRPGEKFEVSDGLCSNNTTDRMEVAEETKIFYENVMETENNKYLYVSHVSKCNAEKNNNAVEENEADGLQTNGEASILRNNELEDETIRNANGLEIRKEIRDASIELREDESMGRHRNHGLHNFEFLGAAEKDCAEKGNENTLEVPVACNMGENQILSTLAKEVCLQCEESDASEIIFSRKEANSPTEVPETTEVSYTEEAENHKHSFQTEEEENNLADREKERDREKGIRLEEKEREREREKDRIAVERANLDAHQRALAEARERAERIAVERVTAEARQRALAEAREKAEKAAEAEKASREAKLRAERAAVERATEEARQRAIEKALVEKAAIEARTRMRKGNATAYFKDAHVKEDSETRLKSSSEILQNAQSRNAASSINGQRYSDSCDNGGSESKLRCKARQERQQRTAERAAKALAEKNMRDILAQREQAERDRLAESLDAEVRRWSSGKEGNLRALLSTLQYILGSDSGWQPVPLTDVLTAVAVKKAYRKATLCVHPDKLQQRGATIQQKYICEKVFDLLKEAWNKFNSEER